MVKELPSKINVMKVVTYDVEQIVSDMVEALDQDPKEVTLTEVMEWIDDWVTEDFGSFNLGELIVQDENGQELNY